MRIHAQCKSSYMLKPSHVPHCLLCTLPMQAVRQHVATQNLPFVKPKGKLEVPWSCRGFPVEQYKQDILGLMLAFWALWLHLGRPLISQTDYKADGTVIGSVLNHVTDGRFVKGQQYLMQVFGYCACLSPMSMVLHHLNVHMLARQC